MDRLGWDESVVFGWHGSIRFGLIRFSRLGQVG